MRFRSFRPALLGGAAMLALTIGAGAAQATVFSGTATFVDTTPLESNGVTATPNPATINASLTAGHSYLASNFMTISTSDTGTDTISLNFVWTQPGAATNSFGGDVYFQIKTDDAVNGLEWANDDDGGYAKQTITFANGAMAEVDVYDATFKGGEDDFHSFSDDRKSPAGTASFAVRIIDLRDPTAVPEPMTLALLGTGLIGIGMVRRKHA
jgi:PEP-CTERM motif-containing protein